MIEIHIIDGEKYVEEDYFHRLLVKVSSIYSKRIECLKCGNTKGVRECNNEEVYIIDFCKRYDEHRKNSNQLKLNFDD